MEIIHNIYILDHPMFVDNNIKFLSYIKKNQETIKDMGVRIIISALTPDQLTDPNVEFFLKSKHIKAFPVLITDSKIYKGLHEIVYIYQTNIVEYNKYKDELQKQTMIQQVALQKQQQQKQQQQMQQQQMQMQVAIKQQDIDSDEQIHSYISQQLHIKTKTDDEDTPFGDGDNMMMDSYRHMISRRNVDKKGPYSSKMRTVEQKNDDDNDNIQNVIFKQLQTRSNSIVTNDTHEISLQKNSRRDNKQNNSHGSDDEREDNIKGEVEEDGINIDPSNIEYDGDEDPQDAILEKAYWNRMSNSI